MKLSDIIALAKQGYKPDDIERLVALSDSEGTDGSAGTEDSQKDEPKTQPDETQPEPDASEEVRVYQTPSEKADEPDYKALYEDTVKQLKVAQAANVKDKVHEEPMTTMDEALLNMVSKIL